MEDSSRTSTTFLASLAHKWRLLHRNEASMIFKWGYSITKVNNKETVRRDTTLQEVGGAL